MVDFDKLNRDTREWRNTCVDRFNPSTRNNYSYFDPSKLNTQTYKQNNGTYPTLNRDK